MDAQHTLMGGTSLPLLPSPAGPKDSKSESLWLHAWRSIFYLKKSTIQKVLVVQMSEMLYGVIDVSVTPGKLPEVDGICLMLCNAIDQ